GMPPGGAGERRRLERRRDRRRRAGPRLGRLGAFDPVRAPALDDRAAAGYTRERLAGAQAGAARFSAGAHSFSSAPGNAWRTSFSFAAIGSGTSRTVKKTLGTCVSRAPMRAVRTPFVRSSARRERAASRLLN